jgi:hypothetical protein
MLDDGVRRDTTSLTAMGRYSRENEQACTSWPHTAHGTGAAADSGWACIMFA